MKNEICVKCHISPLIFGSLLNDHPVLRNLFWVKCHFSSCFSKNCSRCRGPKEDRLEEAGCRISSLPSRFVAAGGLARPNTAEVFFGCVFLKEIYVPQKTNIAH